MDLLGVEYVKVDAEKLHRKEKKAKKRERKKEKKDKKLREADAKQGAEQSSPSGSVERSPAAEEFPEAKEEIDTAQAQVAAPRDDWMTSAPQDRNILTGERLDKQPAKSSAAEEKKESISVKELNPLMAAKRGAAEEEAAAKSSKPPLATVGDGGASWRLKALKRAQALAEEEGRSVNEVVAERHESLAKLTQQLTSQRPAHSKAHLHAQRDRQRERDGAESAGYLKDVGTGQSQMRRPDSSKNLSWRKEGRPKLVREDRKSRDAESGGRGDEPSSSEHRRNTDRRSSGERRQKDPLGRSQDASVLRNAAASLNTFQSDGSFLEAFQNQKQPAEALKGGPGDPEANETHEAAEDPEEKSESIQPPDFADTDNKSAAAALRARLAGKSGAQRSASKPYMASDSKRKQVELLPSVDAEGRAMPGAHGREAAGAGLTGRRPKKLQRYEDGEKTRYFANDDARTLDDLVREQRHGGGPDVDSTLADNISRKARFKERDLDADEEYDVDGGLDMYESRNTKVTKEKAEQRQRASQIADLRRTNRALDSCNLCFSSAKRARHLTIAIGQAAYLSIPNRSRLAPLHCCILPIEHVSSSRRTDEHVWTELRNFKKCIIQMYRAQGLNAVFMEMAMRLNDPRSHAIIHCVPIDDEAFHRAPIVFRKALQEAESEWSQHNAKAVIDTRIKGLRGSVPPNFPYFFVEFGLSEGQLHVIDDEESFDRDFGRSVMAGLLKLGAAAQHRGSIPEPPPIQQKLAAEFGRAFEPFDWTKQL